MKLADPIPVRVEALPAVVRQGAGPDSPPERRLLLARAVIPLAPEDLVATLALLVSDRSEVVSSAARATLEALPWGVLASGVSGASDPGVLDCVARTLLGREGVPALVAQNRATDDETVVFLANRARGDVLEIVAANQMRQQRCPRIVEALYYNPETRMGTVSNVLENAVRMGLDLSHIPGYAEIVTSILGADAVRKVTPGGAAPEPPPEPPPEPAPEPEPARPPAGAEVPVPGAPIPGFDFGAPAGGSAPAFDPGADLARSIEQAMFEAGLSAAPPPGAEPGAMDDDSFFQILANSIDDSNSDLSDDEKKDGALWTKLGEMSIPQKVRLALLGNDFIRGMLIRDPRRIIYNSVLKSPKLNIKDIVGYAKNRSLNDDIIRQIATNRDWTKAYDVKHALVVNPKTPPALAMAFLRSLTPKDLKHVSQSRDCPGYICRQAKNIISTREQGGKPH
ncbi:MAG: hypothetical protein FJ087_19795 [Deltaproteobacteria bacterium]|nr:hypothetical protein [Deltaproteobacteria bacterium]